MSAPDGRFEGDLLAVLQASQAERKPYRVRVWVWQWSYDYEQKKEVLGWYTSRRSSLDPGGYDAVRYFRSHEKAVRYLVGVRAEAERRRIAREIREKRAEGWERIA